MFQTRIVLSVDPEAKYGLENERHFVHTAWPGQKSRREGRVFKKNLGGGGVTFLAKFLFRFVKIWRVPKHFIKRIIFHEKGLLLD